MNERPCQHPDMILLDDVAVCPHCLTPWCPDCSWEFVRAFGQIVRVLLVEPCAEHR